ncbi:MAG: hypothetical protein QXZ65_06460 [Metallosphaera sp.]
MIRLSVIGSKSGIGKSMISYNLARLLSNKYSVTIFDLSSSRTICNVYGIRGNLMDGTDYMAEKGNLKIISASSQFSRSSDIKKMGKVYDDILEETDVFIIDNGVHIYDDEVSNEMILFYEKRNEPTHIIAVSNPQEFVINSTERMIEIYVTLLHNVSDNARAVLEYFIINMINTKTNFKVNVKPFLGVVEIPLYRDLSFNGFWNAEVPKEVALIASKIETLI